MRTLAFIVPAHGRLAIAEVCFRQLRRTCDALLDRGILADAVVIACDENLELARANNFATVERDNSQLGRRLNDGYQAAASAGARYFMPFGNDDWIDPNWIRLPAAPNEIICTHLSAVVNETATRMSGLYIDRHNHYGGDGVRIYPRAVLRKVGFRPADDDRKRAIDTSTHFGIAGAAPANYVFHDVHPLQIVDWKSTENLNDYAGCRMTFGRHTRESRDPFGDLAAIYPAAAISEMRALYDRELVAA